MVGQSVDRQERLEYIDLFRAFGILCMIMGHIHFGSVFDKWIHAFHMPMFFFISGWFFKNDRRVPYSSLVLRKAKKLLRPYLIFEFALWFVCMIFLKEYRSAQAIGHILWENTYKIPVESGVSGISPVPGAMWFLTAIFLAEAIYLLLDQVLGCNWKLHTAVILLVIIGMLSPAVLPFRLPWAADAAMVGIGFFHLARMVRGSRAEDLLHLKLWQALALGLLISVSIMLCPKINMRTGSYGWYLPFWVNAAGAIAAGWNLSRYLETALRKSRLLSSVSCWLKGVGKNSIVYLCLNQICILLVVKVLSDLGIRGAASKILILLLTMLLLFCFEKLICSTKLRVIIGK